MRSFITPVASNDVLARDQESTVVVGKGDALRAGLRARLYARYLSHLPAMGRAIRMAMAKKRRPRTAIKPGHQRFSGSQVARWQHGSLLAGPASSCPPNTR